MKGLATLFCAIFVCLPAPGQGLCALEPWLCPFITTPPTLPAGFAGTPYSETLVLTAGLTANTWRVEVGGLPPGVALSTSGVIAGTPTVAGTSVFVIGMTDSSANQHSQTFSLTVVSGPPRLVITPAALPTGAAPSDYHQNFAASGGSPPYAWAITSGALPTRVQNASTTIVRRLVAESGTLGYTGWVKGGEEA